MKKSGFKSAGNSSRSSFGSSKSSSSSYGRSNAGGGAFSSCSSGSNSKAFSKSLSDSQFKRSASYNTGAKFSCDKKISSISENNWKASKPKYDITSSSTKSSTNRFSSSKPNFEQLAKTEPIGSSWSSSKPKFEKQFSSSLASKPLMNSSWASSKFKVENKVSTGMTVKCSVDSSWASPKPKLEKQHSSGMITSSSDSFWASSKPKVENKVNSGMTSKCSAECSWASSKPKLEKQHSSGIIASSFDSSCASSKPKVENKVNSGITPNGSVSSSWASSKPKLEKQHSSGMTASSFDCSCPSSKPKVGNKVNYNMNSKCSVESSWASSKPKLEKQHSSGMFASSFDSSWSFSKPKVENRVNSGKIPNCTVDSSWESLKPKFEKEHFSGMNTSSLDSSCASSKPKGENNVNSAMTPKCSVDSSWASSKPKLEKQHGSGLIASSFDSSWASSKPEVENKVNSGMTPKCSADSSFAPLKPKLEKQHSAGMITSSFDSSCAFSKSKVEKNVNSGMTPKCSVESSWALLKPKLEKQRSADMISSSFDNSLAPSKPKVERHVSTSTTSTNLADNSWASLMPKTDDKACSGMTPKTNIFCSTPKPLNEKQASIDMALNSSVDRPLAPAKSKNEKQTISCIGSNFLDGSSWVSTMPMYDKQASTDIIPNCGSWTSLVTKEEKHDSSCVPSKYITDSYGSSVLAMPKAEKSSNNGSNCLTNEPTLFNKFLSTESTVLSDNITWPSNKLEIQKPGSKELKPSTNSTWFSSKPLNKKPVSMNHSYNGMVEPPKSNLSNFNTPAVSLNSSNLTAHGPSLGGSQFGSTNMNNNSNKIDKVGCESKFMNGNSSKHSIKTATPDFKEIQSFQVEVGLLSTSESSQNGNCKTSDQSPTNGQKLPRVSPKSGAEKMLHNERSTHHFYDNLSKLFHSKGNSQSKQGSNISNSFSPTDMVFNGNASSGMPSVNTNTPIRKDAIVLSSNLRNENPFKETPNIFGNSTNNKKVIKLKIDTNHYDNSGFSTENAADNCHYKSAPVRSNNNTPALNGYGSTNAINNTPLINGSNVSVFHSPSSPNGQVSKKSLGKSFGKNIFGNLFSKHSGDKKLNNVSVNVNSFNDSPLCASQLDYSIHPQSLLSSQESQNKNISSNSSVIFRQNSSNGCIPELQNLFFTDVNCTTQSLHPVNDSKYKKSSCAKVEINEPLTSNVVNSGHNSTGLLLPSPPKAKKNEPQKQHINFINDSGNHKDIQQPSNNLHLSANSVNAKKNPTKDLHNKCHTDEKTKVIAELLKSYCIQQAQETAGQKALSLVPKSFPGQNKKNELSNCNTKSLVENPNGDIVKTDSINSPSVAKHNATAKTVERVPGASVVPTITVTDTLPIPRANSMLTSPTASIKNISDTNGFGCASLTNSHQPINFHNGSEPTSSEVKSKGAASLDQLSFFKANNLLSSLGSLGNVIGTGPLKKSSKQQRNSPTNKVSAASAFESCSNKNGFIASLSGISHGGIMPSLDNGSSTINLPYQLPDVQPAKKSSKCSKQKHTSNTEMQISHATPFMINSGGHSVPISSYARDAILSALMFSSVNAMRKKACAKQQRCRTRCVPKYSGSRQNASCGLSALGLALPRSTSHPTFLESNCEVCHHDEDTPIAPPLRIPCSLSANELIVQESYFKETIVKSHSVDDFRNSYDKATQVIINGRKLLADGNYLQACVEFEVGLKLMDCILDSRIDESEMSAFDKTICKSIQEVIRVDRKCALEGYSDAQAGNVTQREIANQPSLERAPTAPPSYTDVLREDLEKTFFSGDLSFAENHINHIRMSFMDAQMLDTSAQLVPSEEAPRELPSLPPSYERHESTNRGGDEASGSCNKLLISLQSHSSSVVPSAPPLSSASSLLSLVPERSQENQASNTRVEVPPASLALTKSDYENISFPNEIDNCTDSNEKASVNITGEKMVSNCNAATVVGSDSQNLPAQSVKPDSPVSVTINCEPQLKLCPSNEDKGKSVSSSSQRSETAEKAVVASKNDLKLINNLSDKNPLAEKEDSGPELKGLQKISQHTEESVKSSSSKSNAPCSDEKGKVVAMVENIQINPNIDECFNNQTNHIKNECFSNLASTTKDKCSNMQTNPRKDECSSNQLNPSKDECSSNQVNPSKSENSTDSTSICKQNIKNPDFPTKPLNISDTESSVAFPKRTPSITRKLPPPPLPVYPARDLPTPSVTTTRSLAFPPDVKLLQESRSDVANLKYKYPVNNYNMIDVQNKAQIKVENIYNSLKNCTTSDSNDTYYRNDEPKLKINHSSESEINDAYIASSKMNENHSSNSKVMSCHSSNSKEMAAEFSSPNVQSSRYFGNDKIQILKNENLFAHVSDTEVTLELTDSTAHPLTDNRFVLDPFLFEDPFESRGPDLYLDEEPFIYDDEVFNPTLINISDVTSQLSLSLKYIDDISSPGDQGIQENPNTYPASFTKDTASLIFNDLDFSNDENQYDNDLSIFRIPPSLFNKNQTLTLEFSQVLESEFNIPVKPESAKKVNIKSNENENRTITQPKDSAFDLSVIMPGYERLMDNGNNNSADIYVNLPVSRTGPTLVPVGGVPCTNSQISEFKVNTKSQYLPDSCDSENKQENYRSHVNVSDDGIFLIEKTSQFNMGERSYIHYENVSPSACAASSDVSDCAMNLQKLNIDGRSELHTNKTEGREHIPQPCKQIYKETVTYENVSSKDHESPLIREVPKSSRETNENASFPAKGNVNSNWELNFKKGIKSLSIPSFSFGKTFRQSSDEGRLIGQSLFFIDIEQTEDTGWSTVLRIEDVRVFFMKSNQDITSPSSNQTITIKKEKEKRDDREPVTRLEVGKQLWTKNLNLASSKIFKTINKVYIFEDQSVSDSYVALQLSCNTKLSVIDQFENILKSKSYYQAEVLAKSQSVREHGTIVKKMKTYIKEKSPAFYFQAHELSRLSMRAVRSVTTSMSKGIMNFNDTKLGIGDTPSTSPLTRKLYGQMEIFQVKGRFLEEAQWKNSIIYI